MAELPHVVVLGGGFGGIGAVQKLRDAPVRITLVDKHDFHTFQPLLYQVATDELDPNQVGHPLRELLHRHKNLAFHQTTVESIDLVHRQVACQGMPALDFDFLVIALGGQVDYHGTPGAAEHAIPLYTMSDAIRLHDHILRVFEAVDKNPSLVDQGALTFCIVGGGPTGTELAGAMSELLHTELTKDYPNLPIGKARILLYEHSPNLLEPFAPRLRDYARRALEERGVEIHTQTGVSQITPHDITLSTGDVLPTQTVVWAAGLQANPVAKSLGIPLAAGGRIPVSPTLQLVDHPQVFALGDIATAADPRSGKPLPGLGAVALQQGHFAGAAIANLVSGKPIHPFKYVNRGTMAQVGRGAAVAELPTGGTLTGRVAWLAWLGVHLSLLSGAEERTSVFVDWGWNLMTHKRGKRILLSDEDAAATKPATPD